MTIAPLRPANCGFTVAWSEVFRDRFEGHPLKGVALSFGSSSLRGEAMITRTGIEGGAVYALSADLREAVIAAGEAILHVRCGPTSKRADCRAAGRAEGQAILFELAAQGGASVAGWHRTAAGGGDCLRGSLSSLSPSSLAGLINAVPVKLTGIAPIARAISTAGGISFDELDADFMIRRLPGVFAAGEMLDWEAPTGGYLLQASFATGAAAGRVR